MCKVDSVLIVHELYCKGQSVERGRSRQAALLARIVLDLMTSSVPANVPRLSLLLTVNQWFHAMVVQTVRLDQVDNIEPVRLILPRVRHSKIKPLCELLRCPMIKLQVQVVFKFAYLGGSM